jgi:ribosomal protein S12 methylthiotransferase
LGCDKNRCDSEVIASHFVAQGDSIVDNDADADVMVVNTCGFINSARKESINAIIDKFGYKGENKKIIVCGCLVERYRDELSKEMQEVDMFCTLKELVKTNVNKLLSTPKSYCYIKIAEGCNRQCSFCTIPDIKGGYKSRAIADITGEIKHLAVPEIILVAQDVTAFGMDIDTNLVALLREISKIECVKRIRLHYCYPDLITDELIYEIADNDKICPYLDIPLQHCNQRILGLMNRTGDYRQLTGLIAKLRQRIPNLTIRSTLLVGFPTETDTEFDELLSFINEVKMDYVGFFAYSREHGTKSYNMPQVSGKIKRERLKVAEITQSKILYNKNNNMVGSSVKVVWDGGTDKHGNCICRTAGQSPEVDPCVLVPNTVGRFYEMGTEYTVRITGVQRQNLVGGAV